MIASVTGTCAGVAPREAREIASVYVFDVRPVGFAVTVTVLLSPAVSEPEVGLRLTHEAVLLAVQLKAPVPVLVMVKFCDVEFVEPSVMVNDKIVGL